jgi:hypothetical protein
MQSEKMKGKDSIPSHRKVHEAQARRDVAAAKSMTFLGVYE